MNSGMMVERRDHVLMVFSYRSRLLTPPFPRWSSRTALLSERVIYGSPNDHHGDEQ